MPRSENPPVREHQGATSKTGGCNDSAIVSGTNGIAVDLRRDEPTGVLLARLAIDSTPLPTVPCPWCGAPAGVRCTVVGVSHRLRLTQRQSRCHPSREVAA